MKPKQDNKNNLQFYSHNEIKDYYKYKKKLSHIKFSLDKELKSEKKVTNEKYINSDESYDLLNQIRNERCILNNNTILFKPSIFKSKKQEYYEMNNEKEGGGNIQFNMMKNKDNNIYDENNMNVKLDKFDKKMKEIEHRNYINKIEMLDNFNINFKKNEEEEIKLTSNMRFDRRNQKKLDVEDKNHHDNNKDDKSDDENKSKKVSFCQIVYNYLFGSSNYSYASRKYIWSGEEKVFSQYFQDNRIREKKCKFYFVSIIKYVFS